MSESYYSIVIRKLRGFESWSLSRLAFEKLVFSSYPPPSLNLSSFLPDVVSPIWIFVAFSLHFLYAISYGIVTHLSYVPNDNINLFKNQFFNNILSLPFEGPLHFVHSWYSINTCWLTYIKWVMNMQMFHFVTYRGHVLEEYTEISLGLSVITSLKSCVRCEVLLSCQFSLLG